MRSDIAGTKAKAFVKTHPALSFDNSGYITLSDAFCTDLLAKAEVAIAKLVAEAKTKYYT